MNFIHVEYDDGKSEKAKDKSPHCTRRGRELGFYIVGGIHGDANIPIPVGFMRVSEIKPMEKLLNQVYQAGVWKALQDYGQSNKSPER